VDSDGKTHTLTRSADGDSYTDQNGNVYSLTANGYQYTDANGNTYTLSKDGYSFTQTDSNGNVLVTYSVNSDGYHFKDPQGNEHTLGGTGHTYVAHNQDGTVRGTYEITGTGMVYEDNETHNLTIVDGTGTRFIFKNGNNEDVIAGLNFSNQALNLQADDATIAAAVATQSAILLGGSPDGWLMNSTKIWNMKSLQNVGVIESIALDAALNQIRIASSQIVLDGTNGVLFIGRPGMDPSSSTSGPTSYTSALMLMGGVGIQAKTQGVSTY
jgi:hypothetical protein